MPDSDAKKTKKQLIEELQSLRAELNLLKNNENKTLPTEDSIQLQFRALAKSG